MKKATTYTLLGLAIGILALDHLSSSISSPETALEHPQSTTQKHATNLWSAEISDEKINFQSSGTDIYTLHLPPYSNHVRSRAFNLVTYSRNPVLVTQWKVSGDYRLTIVDPILQKEQMVVTSGDEIYVEASEDNRIAVEYFPTGNTGQANGEEQQRLVWPQSLQ